MPKPSKYRAVPTVVDGIRFASKKEARRYSELRLLEKAGEIQKLQLHPPFKLPVNGFVVCTYVADFAYFEEETGATRHDGGFMEKANGRLVPARLVVEDVKGMKTPAYQIKKKLMKAVLGIEIRET